MRKTTVTLTFYGEGISGLLRHLFRLQDEMTQLESVDTSTEEVNL